MGKSQTGFSFDKLDVPQGHRQSPDQNKARDILRIKLGDTRSNQSVLEREKERESFWHHTPCPYFLSALRSGRAGTGSRGLPRCSARWPWRPQPVSPGPPALLPGCWWVLLGLPICRSLRVLTHVGLESETSEFREEAAGCVKTTCFSQTVNICLSG